MALRRFEAHKEVIEAHEVTLEWFPLHEAMRLQLSPTAASGLLPEQRRFGLGSSRRQSTR